MSLHWLDPGDPFPDVARAWGPTEPAPGLLAAGGQLDVDTLLRAYRAGVFPWFCEGELGYLVAVHVLDAADYQVPQRRKRLIMLASRVHEPAMAPKSDDRVTVRQALKGLEPPSRTKDKLHGLGENRSQAVKDLIALIPKNGGSRSDLEEEHQLDCHKRSDGFYDVYGRMAWDGVSPTITSGCHNPSKGRFLHPSRNRDHTA